MHHVMAVSHVHAKLDTYDTYSMFQDSENFLWS